MTILLDFDQTLFDTAAWKEAMADALLPLGVGKILFYQTYQQSTQERPNSYGHDVERHLQLIAQTLPQISQGEVSKAFRALNERARQFLYPDALSFAQYFRKRPETNLFLFSRAIKDVQHERLALTGLAPLFHRIFIDDRPKHRWVNELLPFVDYPAYHINDNFQETAELLECLPRIQHIIKIGKHGRDRLEEFKLQHLPVFDTLEEVKEYIEVGSSHGDMSGGHFSIRSNLTIEN